jgi:sulfotransferase family protein
VTAVVHIGFHKTGTTALQRQFFPHLPETTFLTHGGVAGRGGSVFRLLSDNLLAATDDEFLEETIRAFLAEMRTRASTMVISHEGLSGEIFGGSYNRRRNAIRLHRVVPDAKILIVVRHQATMLRSIYAQHIRRGGVDRFEEFVLNEAPNCDFDLDHLQYDTLVTLYQELFGHERVLVLMYETLLADPAVFLDQVRGLVGVEGSPAAGQRPVGYEGRSLSPASRWIVRHTNRLFRRSAINPEPRVASIRRADDLPSFLQERVDPVLFRNSPRRLNRRDEALLTRLVSRYEKGNARLERVTGLPLRRAGYPVPTDAMALDAGDDATPFVGSGMRDLKRANAPAREAGGD